MIDDLDRLGATIESDAPQCVDVPIGHARDVELICRASDPFLSQWGDDHE